MYIWVMYIWNHLIGLLLLVFGGGECPVCNCHINFIKSALTEYRYYPVNGHYVKICMGRYYLIVELLHNEHLPVKALVVRYIGLYM